jgi:hypothetical protein
MPNKAHLTGNSLALIASQMSLAVQNITGNSLLQKPAMPTAKLYLLSIPKDKDTRTIFQKPCIRVNPSFGYQLF